MMKKLNGLLMDILNVLAARCRESIKATYETNESVVTILTQEQQEGATEENWLPIC